MNFSRSDRGACTERLRRNVDHLGAAIFGDMGKAPHGSTPDGNHLPARLIIVPEIVLLRFSIDNIEKELAQFIIVRAGSEWFHDVELEKAAEAWSQLPI